MVLVLTEPQRAEFFRARIPDATVVTDAAALDGEEAAFDSALLDGVLEGAPWDRWLLQRVHRLLRMDAPIVVVVPPLLSLASATDVGFLIYACRQVILRLARRLKPAFYLPGEVHRRYYLPRLARKMASVGYTAIAPGAAWPGSDARGTPSWLARRTALTARKTSSLSGTRGRAWPDAVAHRAERAPELAGQRAARKRWLAGFPGGIGRLAPSALEPKEWREARVLVLSPHPDDELIGCGGTLCRIIAAGAEVTVLHATDGSKLDSLRDLAPARRKSIRLQEAKQVASALGARVVLWRDPDAELRSTPATVGKLARLLGRLRPTHIFAPFLGDPHPDHAALNVILAGALATARDAPQVLQYEVWGLVPANLYCDTTRESERLERLLHLYERAMRVDDFVHFCESRNLARAWELTGRPGYVEAFLSTTTAEYLRLASGTHGR